MKNVATTWALSLSGLLLLATSQWVWADSREAVNETRAVSANEKIYIEVMRGDVRIKAVERNEFKISGKLDEQATGFTLNAEGGFTRFEMTMPRNTGNDGWRNIKSAELVVEVPRGANLEFKGVNTKLAIEGVNGSSKIGVVNGDIYAKALGNVVELSTVNGKISSEQLSGRIELTTVNGNINDKASSGRVIYSAVNGKIEADSQASDVNLSVVNGKAELDLRKLSELKMSTVNGDLEIEVKDSVSPRITGSTVSGDIDLKLAKNINARFNLNSSAGGSIQNELTDAKPVKAKYGPGRSLQFSHGDGSGLIELTSVSGKLKLEKE